MLCALLFINYDVRPTRVRAHSLLWSSFSQSLCEKQAVSSTAAMRLVTSMGGGMVVTSQRLDLDVLLATAAVTLHVIADVNNGEAFFSK